MKSIPSMIQNKYPMRSHHFNQSMCHPIYRVLLIVLLLLLPSCSTITRVETQHRTVTDTMLLAIADTTHHVFTHDTTIVTHREYITEHIIQRYDRETGRIAEQEITRIIQRRADSIAAHRLDSLMHANRLTANHVRADSAVNVSKEEHQPVISPISGQPLWQRIVFSSFGLLVIVVILSWLCLKAYLKRD